MRTTLALIALAVVVPAAAPSAAEAAWPVAPRDQQHPVRGAFLDPRPGRDGLVFHNGVDISVRDDFPERGHPPQRTHRVYALEGGVVEYPSDTYVRRCSGRMVRVGRFTYGHVDPVGFAWRGSRVEAGQMIGWTCKGQWHLHLAERRSVDGQLVTVNPLRRGGVLTPYVDVTPPSIHELSFSAPAPAGWQVVHGAYASTLDAPPADSRALRGLVQARVRAGDPAEMAGWPAQFALLGTEHAPAEVRVTLTRVADGRLLWSHAAFRADYLLPSGRPPVGSFAPGTTQSLPAERCLTSWVEAGCAGQLWFPVAPPGASTWDTREYSNGAYDLCVVVHDAVRNDARSCSTVTIAN